MNATDFTSDLITIQLTKGQQTIVSIIDADLQRRKWQAMWSRNYHNGGKFVARRGYRVRGEPNLRSELLHRVILSRMLGRELLKGEMVDHINGNPLDNRRKNLRLATASENSANTGKYTTNTSGYKGVYQDLESKKWRAAISVKGKRISLGRFDTPEAAYEAYCKAAQELHGEFFNPG